tara:strand:- start:1423 stop:2244 length:822 start_codon:yes stop_codon:yes gene_type:complete
MKILITGANGFLGGVLCSQLQDTNHLAFATVRKKNNPNDIECDLGNIDILLTVLNKYQPDVIINCAAKVNFLDDSEQEQYNVNALAPSVIASWCAENNAHLIQTSGSIVNGNSITQFSNDSLELPINFYGKTKLLADRAIRLSQCDYTVVRFGGIFGENGPSHLGINNAINQSKEGNVPTIIGKGEAIRNYIHVQDAAKLLIHCVENKIIGTHYAGSQQSISIAQMIKDICSIYLSNQEPKYKDGEESIDQITKVSVDFPETLPFKKALKAYR